MGARPQVVEPRRRGSLGLPVIEHASRLRSASGPLPWAVNGGGGAEPLPSSPVVTREVPWRAPSGSRHVFAPPPPPATGSGRAEMSEGVGRTEEQRSRLRTLRQRLQLDRGNEGVRVFRPGMLRGPMGRRGNLGDYVVC